MKECTVQVMNLKEKKDNSNFFIPHFKALAMMLGPFCCGALIEYRMLYERLGVNYFFDENLVIYKIESIFD